MSSGFTREQVSAIAALANLELDAAEVDLYARQLGDILTAAEAVQAVNTAGVPPTSSTVTRHASDRPDEVGPCLTREESLANAPDASLDAGLFKVPRVIG